MAQTKTKRRKRNGALWNRIKRIGSRTTVHHLAPAPPRVRPAKVKTRVRRAKVGTGGRAALTSAFKGYQLAKYDGAWHVPQLDADSTFDSKEDAKRFIDSWVKQNPHAHGQRRKLLRMRETNPAAFDRCVETLSGNPRGADALMQEHIHMPGFPQLIVTRAWAHATLKRMGHSERTHGYGSLDYMVFHPQATDEPLTPVAERDAAWESAFPKTNPPRRGSRGPTDWGSFPTQVERFVPRFVLESQIGELSQLWHLSRTALAGGDISKWARMNWAAKEFSKAHPEVSQTAAYKDLDGMLENVPMRRNPEAAAASLFETFHGRPATQVETVTEDVHEHDWLAPLGDLTCLRIKTESGYGAEIAFKRTGSSRVTLSSSEDGTSMYFVGGDQSVDLDALHMGGKKWRKDLMVLGRLKEIEYFTEKGFDDFKPTIYWHKLREGLTKDGTRHTIVADKDPVLLYDSRSKLLQLAGGQYSVEDVGIVG